MNRWTAMVQEWLRRETSGESRFAEALGRGIKYQVEGEIARRMDRLQIVVIGRILEPQLAAAAKEAQAGNAMAAYGRLNAAIEEALDELRKAVDPERQTWG